MKTKKVSRYWCDFCGKQGGSAGHMRKHERSCTLNPNRECGVCKMLENVQKPILELIASFNAQEAHRPKGTDEWQGETWDSTVLNRHLPALRRASGECPACIMAAIRQSKVPVPAVTDFSFTKDMQALWTDINDANSQGHV